MPGQICDFTVTIEQAGPYLNSEIILKDPSDECRRNARYFFYLVKDGAVIDRKGWFAGNSYRWVLSEPGRYLIQGYVRMGEERKLNRSEELVCLDIPADVPESALLPSLPVGVSIFGSCTTRDLFRLFPTQDLELKSYVARQSVVSAVSEPVPLEMDEIKLDSNFQKTAVWRDFNKTTFEVLRGDGSDWLIIDLIDERFSPMRIGDSYVTKSSMAVQGGVIPEEMRGSARIRAGEDFLLDGVSLKSYVSRFAEKLLEIYRPDHIIIHRAMTVDRYWDAAGNLCYYSQHELDMGKAVNEIISCMYDRLEECIPQAKVIDCISKYHGSEQHCWGRANVHYEDGYYAEVMREITSIVVRQDKRE